MRHALFLKTVPDLLNVCVNADTIVMMKETYETRRVPERWITTLFMTGGYNITVDGRITDISHRILQARLHAAEMDKEEDKL